MESLWRNDEITLTEGKWRTRRETRPSATLSTTNPTFLSSMWNVNVKDSPFCGAVPPLLLNLRPGSTWVLMVRSWLLLRRISWLSTLASGRYGEVSASDRVSVYWYCTLCGVVCTVTSARAGGSGDRFPTGARRDFRLNINVQNGSGVSTACWVRTGLFPWG